MKFIQFFFLYYDFFWAIANILKRNNSIWWHWNQRSAHQSWLWYDIRFFWRHFTTTLRVWTLNNILRNRNKIHFEDFMLYAQLKWDKRYRVYLTFWEKRMFQLLNRAVYKLESRLYLGCPSAHFSPEYSRFSEQCPA